MTVEQPDTRNEYARQTFTAADYSRNNLAGYTFLDCEFQGCNFSGADLSATEFDNCLFQGCNLTNPVIGKTKFINIRFIESKLMGINFLHCNTFALDVGFENCLIRMCNFSELKMKRIPFLHCDISECDFKNSFLPEANFSGSTFRDTFFHNTDLEKADFRGASGYAIDPRANKVKKAKFSLEEAVSLLRYFDIEVEV